MYILCHGVLDQVQILCSAYQVLLMSPTNGEDKPKDIFGIKLMTNVWPVNASLHLHCLFQLAFMKNSLRLFFVLFSNNMKHKAINDLCNCRFSVLQNPLSLY